MLSLLGIDRHTAHAGVPHHGHWARAGPGSQTCGEGLGTLVSFVGKYCFVVGMENKEYLEQGFIFRGGERKLEPRMWLSKS